MQKKHLYIFGAAGFAAEVAMIAADTGLYDVRAFVEADSAFMPERTSMEVGGRWIPIIPESQLTPDMCAGCAGAIAIANASVSRRIAERFTALLEFPAIVHPSARTCGAEIGGGCILYPGVIVSWHSVIGPFCKLQARVTVGHECTLGAFCELNPMAVVSGCVDIGPDCLIGAAAAIRQGLVIGHGATVGMGAVVVKNVAAATVVAGVPAKPLRQ